MSLRRRRLTFVAALQRVGMLLATVPFLASLAPLQSFAQSVEWSAAPCTYSVVFPGAPRIETASRNQGAGQGGMDMVSAGLVKSDTGVLLAGCATFAMPIGETEVQGFVSGITSGLLTRVLDEGPCTFQARDVPCRTVETIEMVNGEPRRSATVRALADGTSVFFVQILSIVNATADSRAIDDNFLMSLAPVPP